MLYRRFTHLRQLKCELQIQEINISDIRILQEFEETLRRFKWSILYD